MASQMCAVLDARLITGGAGTGKTERLVGRVAELVEGGARGEDILVFAATPDAARAFCERVRGRLGEPARAVNVVTPRQFALGLLREPGAAAFTGRSGRLLLPFEESILMEDMKASGLRQKRLKEMLKFFYRSWTELADDDPAWLISDEERSVHALIKDCLAFTGGMLEPEVSNLAVNYLRTHGEALAGKTVAHVVVDDYQALSRASQVLANMLAGRSIWVAADRHASAPVFDSYPYASGVDEFCSLHGDAVVVELSGSHRSRATVRAVNALCTERRLEVSPQLFAADDVADGAFETRVFPSPEEEIAGIGAYVGQMLASGTDPGAIYVAAPNSLWEKNVARELASRGIEVATKKRLGVLRRDPRDEARCVGARVFTMLALVANPEDAVAWRSWCGFGNYLAHSPVFAVLRPGALEAGLGVRRVVEAVETSAASREYAEEARDVAIRYRRGLAIIDAVAGKTGADLLAAITCLVEDDQKAEVPRELFELCDPADGDGAGEMVVRVCAQHGAPSFGEQSAVMVGDYGGLCGLDPDVVVFAGFVNGFFPSRGYFDKTEVSDEARERMHEADCLRLYGALSKARRSVLITAFSSIDLGSAERLKLKIDRIRVRNGVRMCALSPSVFVEAMTTA